MNLSARSVEASLYKLRYKFYKQTLLRLSAENSWFIDVMPCLAMYYNGGRLLRNLSYLTEPHSFILTWRDWAAIEVS